MFQGVEILLVLTTVRIHKKSVEMCAKVLEDFSSFTTAANTFYYTCYLFQGYEDVK